MHGAQDLNVEGPLLHELSSGFALAANVYLPTLAAIHAVCSTRHFGLTAAIRSVAASVALTSH